MLAAVPPTALEASVLSSLLAVTLEAFPPQWPALHDLERGCVDTPEREWERVTPKYGIRTA